MNTSTHMTPSKSTATISASHLEELPPLDCIIKSNEQFISIIVPRLEKIIPDYLCDGLLPYPMGVYYGKNNGEYLYGLLDTLSNAGLQHRDNEGFSPVLLAIYFGNANGEHKFNLIDIASDAEGVGSVVECVPLTLENEEAGPY